MSNDKVTVQALLKDLDFSEAEAQTYWALLNLESVSIRKVADYSGINRGTTYEAIKQLVNAGLVNTRRVGQREYFSAESPDKIFDLIKDKRKDLWESQQQAQKLIPELLARKARPQGTPLVRYYEDDEGIATILRDVLQTVGKLEKPEYCTYSSRSLRDHLYRKFPNFTDRRIAEGIAVRVIAIGEGGEQDAMSERRWLSEPTAAQTSSYTMIYGNKVALISAADSMTPYGVIIEDAGVATMQRLLFEQLWTSLA